MTKMNELYEKVAKDEALQAEVSGIMKNAGAGNIAETQEKLIGFAKKEGYDVTIEEVSAFFEGMLQERQLSETELDAVAGGKDQAFSSFFDVVGVCLAQSYTNITDCV